MNRAAHWVLAGACLFAGGASAQGAFQSPLDVPAIASPLAIQAPINALATAGNRIVAAGQRGHILYSDDGKAWQQAAVPQSVDLTALSFAGDRQGWAVGHQGVILHSTDGGASWSRQAAGKQTAEPLLDVFFEDERRGFAVGAFNQILRTEDGGKTWASWADRVDNPDALHLYAIRPALGTLFIVGEQGLVLRLDPASGRFVKLPIPYRGSLFGVAGMPEMVLVFGLRGNAWRSTDGTHWTRVETGLSESITSGAVRPDGSVVLASQDGQLLLSTDRAERFHAVQAARSAPAFAVAAVGKDAVAMAGLGAVRLETFRK